MKANINELKLDFVELQAYPEKYDIVIIGVTKRCDKCNNIKLLIKFGKEKLNKDGLKSSCKKCQSNYNKNYRKNNQEQIKKQRKEYRENNQEQIKEQQKKWYKNNKEQKKEYLKEWYENNKEQILENQKEYYENNKEQRKEYLENNKEQIKERQNKYYKNRKRTDPLYKLKENIRCRITTALKNQDFTKKSRTAEILGCSFEEFQEHIGKQMSRWMNWENHGKYKKDEFNFGWDVDHIIPLSSAKTEEELIKLCHYTNLQPLCSKVNRNIKRDKTDFYDNQNQ